MSHAATDRRPIKSVFLAQKVNICLKRKDLFLSLCLSLVLCVKPSLLPRVCIAHSSLGVLKANMSQSSQAHTWLPQNNPDPSHQLCWISLRVFTGWTQCEVGDDPQESMKPLPCSVFSLRLMTVKPFIYNWRTFPAWMFISLTSKSCVQLCD